MDEFSEFVHTLKSTIFALYYLYFFYIGLYANRIIYILCYRILQPIKLQELCDNSMVWKDSYYMPNNKEPVWWIFNSEDKKKPNYFKKLFCMGTELNEVILN